jgi:hypothetical protein
MFAIFLCQGIDQRLAILVRVGIGECKLHPVFLIEGEAEGKLRLVA